MNIKAISHLILLMDALNLEINPESIRQYWSLICPKSPLDDETITSLLNLWDCRKRPNTSAEIPNSIDDSTNISALKADNYRKAETISDKPASMALNSDNLPVKGPEIDNNPQISVEKEPKSDLLYGRYIYGIITGDRKTFTTRGIDNNPVYVIWHQEIGAVAHACKSTPYQSSQADQITEWLKQHQNVLDEALLNFQSLLPMSFDIIIDGSSQKEPDDSVVSWLQSHYQHILEQLDLFSGKVEYGIRITCATETLVDKARTANPAIQKLNKRIAAMKPGTAYLYRAELARLIRNTVASVRSNLKSEIIQRLKSFVIDFQEIESRQVHHAGEMEQILNIAVLTIPDEMTGLGQILEEFQNTMAVHADFTGPWPVYNFIKSLD